MNVYIWEDIPPLNFTANTSNSTVILNKIGSPTSVTLETSTDGESWSTYTFGDTITLDNVGDKVYFRNTSETDTRFSIDASNYYQFGMTGSISASGDVTSLLNKNLTTTLSDYCFFNLFRDCTSLRTLIKLPALVLTNRCYANFYRGCTNIKLNGTQTGEYQTPYRIPTEGTGTMGDTSLAYMFNSTGGGFAGTPTINTTYYTSNTVA